jgi:hypothetical protein
MQSERRGGHWAAATGEKEHSQKKTFQSSKRQKSVGDDTKGGRSDRPFKRWGGPLFGSLMTMRIVCSPDGLSGCTAIGRIGVMGFIVSGCLSSRDRRRSRVKTGRRFVPGKRPRAIDMR